MKHIKNSTLLAWFSFFVLFLICLSLVVKILILISQSTFDSYHQFILEVKEQNRREKIIAFNSATNGIVVLQVATVASDQDIQSLQIPIDAQYRASDNTNTLSSILFSMLFHCWYPMCNGINTVDAFKLYFFSKHIHQGAIETNTLLLPASQTKLNTLLPTLFIDDRLYHEALSISIINASGQSGLGTTASELLTTIGANVVSVTSGDIQPTTTIFSTYGNDTYSLQRIQKVLHTHAQKMQKPGISDIIITIGEKHPQL